MTTTDYTQQATEWRESMEATLRSETGWLTLTGLYWLENGINSIGTDEQSSIILPAGVPHLGVIDFVNEKATLRVETAETVMVDGIPVREAVLRDSSAEAGPSYVSIGTVTFFVLQRGDSYAVRVRDSNNPARKEFAGRNWFPVDERYNVTARFTPHETPRKLESVNSAGQTITLDNIGSVTFDLLDSTITLEAFDAGEGQIWFIFRDGTSGKATYGAGRFLYASLAGDNSVSLDFNKAYHPPCAFTAFATCPYPPRENFLTVDIPVGERN